MTIFSELMIARRQRLLNQIKMNTEAEIPPAHPHDVNPNLRDVVCERLIYGVRLSEPDVIRIREFGYTLYFLRFAGSMRRLGGRTFKKLRSEGRLDLTTEYVLFHYFRERLDLDTRRRLAAILAESVSHPHARRESQSQS